MLCYLIFILLFFRSTNYVTLVTAQLIVMATHMVLDCFHLMFFPKELNSTAPNLLSCTK